VTVAQITRSRGNRGEVSAILFTNQPERLAEMEYVALFGPGFPRGARHTVESVWQHGGRWVLKFRGVDTISDAELLAGAEVRIPKSQRAPLGEGEYYFAELIGCEVVDRKTGESLGRVSDWHEYGGPGVLEVGKLLIPFARSICVLIDVTARRIEVELPEGLKDLV
jgi:16S rRNA processing protein RimM